MVHNKSVLNCSSANFDLLASLIYSENQFGEVNSSRPPDKHKSKVQLKLRRGSSIKRVAPGVSHVQLSFSRRRVNISFYASPTSYLLLTAPNSK